MSAFRFLTTNYVDVDLVANYDVSSEQAAFPITNAFNGQRRSKVWRSNGYFNIISGDNTIIFDEGGADLTATVTAGEYTSMSSFLTALASAFQTAPGAAGTYTATQNSSLKITITKTAGTFNISWTDSSSADMAAILGFDTASDSTGYLTYSSDVLKIASEEFIVWDMGIASNPTALAMIGPRNRAIKISPSAVIYLQGNETNNWTVPSYSTTLTYDDEVIAMLAEDGLHTSSLRYWRVKILDQSNPLGYVEIGAFFLGVHYSPTRGRAQFPFSIDPDDRTEIVYSEDGQAFSDIKQKTQNFSVSWKGLTIDEKEDLVSIFETYGTGTPFFVSFDSDAVFSSDFNRNLKYVRFKEEPKFNLVTPNNFEATMSFREDL